MPKSNPSEGDKFSSLDEYVVVKDKIETNNK